MHVSQPVSFRHTALMRLYNGGSYSTFSLSHNSFSLNGLLLSNTVFDLHFRASHGKKVKKTKKKKQAGCGGWDDLSGVVSFWTVT